MPADDIEQVLANWIRLAISPPGQLAEGIDPARWVAQRFIEWWRSKGVEPLLGDAELAMHSLRSELEQLGGGGQIQLAGAMHELAHLQDALAGLRAALGLPDNQ